MNSNGFKLLERRFKCFLINRMLDHFDLVGLITSISNAPSSNCDRFTYISYVSSKIHHNHRPEFLCCQNWIYTTYSLLECLFTPFIHITWILDVHNMFVRIAITTLAYTWCIAVMLDKLFNKNISIQIFSCTNNNIMSSYVCNLLQILFFI